MPPRSNRSRRDESPARNPTPGEVRAARDAAGLTQEQAAALIYATRRSWQDYEGGQRRMHPGLWELFQIKLALAQRERA